MAKNAVSDGIPTKYEEAPPLVNFEEFKKVIESRRSVRIYEPTPIPDVDIEKVLDLTLLAPNSSNLQPWEFYWIKDPNKKTQLATACLSQQAATTAAVLIVCVAQPTHWKKHCRQMADLLSHENAPVIAQEYYTKIAPLAYRLGMLGWLKRLTLPLVGLFKVLPRVPSRYSELREWAVKSTALACENMMLSFRALGYDSCPMEGFDEVRVKKILKLKRHAHIVMVISAGKRAKNGIYSPRIRFPKEQFIKII